MVAVVKMVVAVPRLVAVAAVEAVLPVVVSMATVSARKVAVAAVEDVLAVLVCVAAVPAGPLAVLAAVVAGVPDLAGGIAVRAAGPRVATVMAVMIQRQQGSVYMLRRDKACFHLHLVVRLLIPAGHPCQQAFASFQTVGPGHVYAQDLKSTHNGCMANGSGFMWHL
jgi:hypothetical protein